MDKPIPITNEAPTTYNPLKMGLINRVESYFQRATYQN